MNGHGIRCRLSKVKGGINVRTQEFEGVTLKEPTVGGPFIMTGPPLESGDTRLIRTSEVVSVDYRADLLPRSNRVLEFTTRNSTYRYEEL